MIVLANLVFIPIFAVASKSCIKPAIPLASTFTWGYGENEENARGTFTCQKDFIGIGHNEIQCQNGEWDEIDFQCSTNVALNKPTFYNSDVNQTASALTVDGDVKENQVQSESHAVYFCDQDFVDSTKKVWTVDIQEEVKVVAVNIRTHAKGNTAQNVEVQFVECFIFFLKKISLQIRVGRDVDHRENQLCWIQLQMTQGQEKTYECTESINGR